MSYLNNRDNIQQMKLNKEHMNYIREVLIERTFGTEKTKEINNVFSLLKYDENKNVVSNDLLFYFKFSEFLNKHHNENLFKKEIYNGLIFKYSNWFAKLEKFFLENCESSLKEKIKEHFEKYELQLKGKVDHNSDGFLRKWFIDNLRLDYPDLFKRALEEEKVFQL